MLKSMTGFGRGESANGACSVVCEAKSVNGKYFDVNAKLPKSFSAFEPKLKELIVLFGVSRGKLDVFFEVSSSASSSKKVEADINLAKQYFNSMRALANELGIEDNITLRDIISRSDVLTVGEQDISYEDFSSAAEKALSLAINQLVSMREAEGEKLFADISRRISTCRVLADEIDRLSEKSKSGYYLRLEERLRAVLADNRVTPDESRMLTECAIFADRVAIDEETVRLRAHFEAFTSLMREDMCGRRLDFLVQEMNREVNTIGSKCADSDIAHRVVSLKNEIEKIREQIQNIE